MDKKAFIKYLSALLMFGLNGIVASNIALNSHEIVFLRTLIGSAVLVFLFLINKGKFHIIKYKKDSIFIMLSGMAMGTSWMFLYEAYQQIGVSFSSLLYYCGPAIVIIFSPLIFKEKLSIYQIGGFLIVLTGIVLLNGNVVYNSSNIEGILCGGMSAIMYFFMVTLNKFSKNIMGLENSVIQLVASFLTVALYVGVRQGFCINVSADDWVWIFILGVVNTGIGCYLYFSPLAKLSVQTVAIFGYLEPLSAVFFAFIFLKEEMAVEQIVGAVCIIGGAMLSELVKNNNQK